MKRMRTIKQALSALKELDSGLNITECSIRTLYKNNKIRSVLIGRKILIDLDSLIEYLVN